MNSVFDGNKYVARLDKGERLLAGLREFCASSGLASAMLSGIGGVQEVELGFYNLKTRQYQWQTFAQLLEIISLNGTIALDQDGEPVFHIHGAFADEQYQVVGGHVRDLVVGGTCELAVTRINQPLHRKLDDETGLKLLDV